MKTKHHPRDIRICPGKRQWFRSPSLSFLVSSSRRTKDPSQYSNNTIRFRYYSISSKQITRQDRFATVNTRQNTLLHRHPSSHSFIGPACLSLSFCATVPPVAVDIYLLAHIPCTPRTTQQARGLLHKETAFKP